MRRGATLVELLIALTVLALLLAMGGPPLAAQGDRLAVRRWAGILSGAHTRARLLALAEQRVMLLTITADSLVIRAVESPVDTVVRWRSTGPSAEAVSLAGGPRTVAFAPIGIAFGVANGTYTLTRRQATRSVIVSRYGRLREN